MFLEEWFKKYNIPQEAIHEFKVMTFRVEGVLKSPEGDLTESYIQKMIRLEACAVGGRLWRNNVGAVHTSDNRFIRFGLANESKKENLILKSSDLVGIKPVKVTQEMVGRTFGQFWCKEVKTKGWRYSEGDARSRAQLAWINLINTLGGDACFASGAESKL